MLMAFATSTWDVLIVYSLNPICVFVAEVEGSREGLRNVHVYTNPSIRSVSTMLCRFYYSHKDTKSVPYAFEDFLQLKFPRE